MMKRCSVHTVGWVLLFVGGLNWGIVGLLNLNIINLVLGSVPTLERIVYVLVGISAILVLFEGSCRGCKRG